MPLFSFQHEDERWYLLGVVSFGTNTCDSSLPGVYSRLTSFIPWILDNVWYKKSPFTVCPGSSDPFYIVFYYIKWVTIYWTYSTTLRPCEYFLENVIYPQGRIQKLGLEWGGGGGCKQLFANLPYKMRKFGKSVICWPIFLFLNYGLGAIPTLPSPLNVLIYTPLIIPCY